jgi:hypothetical protein
MLSVFELVKAYAGAVYKKTLNKRVLAADAGHLLVNHGLEQ